MSELKYTAEDMKQAYIAGFEDMYENSKGDRQWVDQWDPKWEYMEYNFNEFLKRLENEN